MLFGKNNRKAVGRTAHQEPTMQRRTFFTASAALALSTGIPALASPDSAPEILLPKSSFDLRVFT